MSQLSLLRQCNCASFFVACSCSRDTGSIDGAKSPKDIRQQHKRTGLSKVVHGRIARAAGGHPQVCLGGAGHRIHQGLRTLPCGWRQTSIMLSFMLRQTAPVYQDTTWGTGCPRHGPCSVCLCCRISTAFQLYGSEAQSDMQDGFTHPCTSQATALHPGHCTTCAKSLQIGINRRYRALHLHLHL